MVVYRRNLRSLIGSIGKWVIAAIIFILAMTVTWDDVHGFSLSSQRPSAGIGYHSDPGTMMPVDNTQPTPEEIPQSVPEPLTLLLVGGGLGVAAVVRRIKNEQ